MDANSDKRDRGEHSGLGGDDCLLRAIFDAVATPPVPGRCIWCRCSAASGYSDESHVLPNAIGNRDHVLPPGVVCLSCNNYFSRDVDTALLNFAPLAMTATLLEAMNPRKDRLFRGLILGKVPIPEASPK